ncbi:hypothetical protein D3C72_2307800 [compost metagenome]
MDLFPLVIRADADVQATVDPLRNAAPAAEEAVADTPVLGIGEKRAGKRFG